MVYKTFSDNSIVWKIFEAKLAEFFIFWKKSVKSPIKIYQIGICRSTKYYLSYPMLILKQKNLTENYLLYKSIHKKLKRASLIWWANLFRVLLQPKLGPIPHLIPYEIYWAVSIFIPNISRIQSWFFSLQKVHHSKCVSTFLMKIDCKQKYPIPPSKNWVIYFPLTGSLLRR